MSWFTWCLLLIDYLLRIVATELLPLQQAYLPTYQSHSFEFPEVHQVVVLHCNEKFLPGLACILVAVYHCEIPVATPGL